MVYHIFKNYKEGESGRNTINQLTRYLTIAICAVQAPGYLTALSAYGIQMSSSAWWTSYIVLITGTLFAMWIGKELLKEVEIFPF